MKIAFIADTHFHTYNEFARTIVDPQLSDEPINSRLYDQLVTFMRIAKRAKQEGCSHLVIAGDLFHIRGSVPTEVFQFVYQYLYTVQNALGLEVIVLTGNHDQSNKSGTIHSVYGLRNLVKVIDRPQSMILPRTCEDFVKVYFVPYIADKDKLKMAIQAGANSGAQIFVGHCGVDGAAIGPIEYRIKDPLVVEDFQPDLYQWILLGHYHKPQQLYDNLLYIGSPAQINRGEAGETKRWLLYDSETQKLKSIKTEAKEFRTITDADFSLKSDLGDHYYDVVMADPELSDHIHQKAHKFSVKFVPKKQEVATKARIEIADGMTDEQLLKAYISYKLPDSKIPNALYNLGMSTLNKASQNTNNTRFAIARVVADNFMSIGHADLKLHRPGTVISVQGDNESADGYTSNGAGKSSLLPESIFWCLWGETARDLPVDKVVNNKVKRNCSVRIVAAVGNTKLDVTRYRKHKELGGDGIKLIINDVDCTEGTPKLTQLRLDKELGIDFVTFSSVMAFSPDTLRFVSSPDSDQKHVLDSILQTRRFTAALEIAKKAHATVKTSWTETSRKAERCSAAVENLETISAQYQTLNENWQKREEARVADLERAIAREVSNRDSKQEVLTEMNNDFNKKQAEWERLDSEIPADYSDELGEVASALGTSKADVFNIEHSLKKTQKLLDDAVNQAGKPCMTCGQVVSNTGKLIANYQAERNRLQKELDAARTVNLQCNERYQQAIDAKNQRAALVKKAQAAKDATTATFRSIASLEATIKAHDDTIAKYRKDIHNVPVNDYTHLLPKTLKELEDKKTELSVLNTEVYRGNTAMERLQFWINAFGNSGIRSFLLDQILPELSQYANAFSAKLTGGSINIGFQTHKEGVATDRFIISAINEDGSDIYKGNSSGEKRRVDVCIMLGLFRVAYNRTRFNVLLLDETLDTLDKAGLENVVLLLEELARDLSLTIFVTSHTTDVQAYIQDSITIKKVNGIATLQE